MKEFKGKLIKGDQEVSGKLIFRQPIIANVDFEKITNPTRELKSFDQALKKVKNDLWDSIKKVKDDNYYNTLTLIEDPIYANDVKHAIKVNKMSASAAVSRISEKYMEMFNNVDEVAVKNNKYLIKFSEYLLFKELKILDEQEVIIRDDVIYLIDEFDLYTLEVLKQVQPKGIIVWKNLVDQETLNRTFKETTMISLEENREVFNEFIYGEEINLLPKKGVIQYNFSEQFADLVDEIVELEELEEINEIENAVNELVDVEIFVEDDNELEIALENDFLHLGVYVLDPTKPRMYQNSLIVNTDRLFLEQRPTISEQVEVYSNLIKANKEQEISFVLLNVNGSCKPSWLDYGNYFSDLLVRGIRLAYLEQNLFEEQIKAILIAAKNSEKQVTILLPSVSTNEEFFVLRDEIMKMKKELRSQNVEVGDVKVSLTLETPSLGYEIHDIINLVDEVVVDYDSLTQYLLGVEKNNQLFKHLYQPLNPNVLKFIQDLNFQVLAEHKKMVVIGSSLTDPLVLIALIGLGITNFAIDRHFQEQSTNLINHFGDEITMDVISTVLNYQTANDVIDELQKYYQAKVSVLKA